MTSTGTLLCVGLPRGGGRSGGGDGTHVAVKVDVALDDEGVVNDVSFRRVVEGGECEKLRKPTSHDVAAQVEIESKT